VVHRNLPRVSEFDYRRLAAYSLQRFDIVFSRVGSVDRNALVRDPEVGWLFSGRLIRLRFKGGAAFPPFFNQYFHSEPFKERVRTVAVGQTMASLNTRLLGGVMVELPPLSEQCAIAAILAAMDEEIALWEAKLAKARQVKHGMMQELLTGRIRLV
jgi:type I restriction enzyme S subunit